MIYVLIFLAKMAEVSIATVRSVLVNRGMREIAVVLASIEITLWLVVTAKVLTNLQSDVWQGVAYGVAFVAGIYAGMVIEDKLALGLARIEIIAEKELARKITRELRERGYGVTSLDSMGKKGDTLLLLVDVRRKDVEETIEFVQQYDGIYATVCDIKSVKIGQIGPRSLNLLD